MKKLAKKIVRFFIEVKEETKKVHLPSKKDMVKYTLATFFSIFIFGAFFMLSDMLFTAVKVMLG